MKRNSAWLYFVLIPVLFLAGCGGKNVETGMDTAEKAISIPSLLEMEKRGVKKIVSFPIIMSPGIGGVEGQGFYVKNPDGSTELRDTGVYPIAILKKDGSVVIENGFYFVTKRNKFGDTTARAIIVEKKNEIDKMIFLSRDGHLMSNSKGIRRHFDSDKFYSNPEYQKKFLADFGETSQDIEGMLAEYFRKRNLETQPMFVEEIEVGSTRWAELKNQVANHLKKGYRLKNGEVRQGYVSLEEFQELYAKNQGATSGQRFAKGASVVFTGEPVSSAILTGGSLVNGAIQANTGIDEGFYSQAPCKREDLADRFDFFSQEYKEVIRKLQNDLFYAEERINYLEEKIRRQGGTP